MPSPNVVVTSDFGPIIINIHDTIIGRSLITNGSWAKGEIRLLIEILNHRLKTQQSVLVYDVGANIGTHSLALAKFFGAKIMIRAFEAQRPIAHMLCGTLALNNLTNVIVHHGAVSHQAGDDLEITLPDYHHANNFGSFELMEPKLSDNGRLKRATKDVVKTLRLDDFDEAVDLLKMDIEGMEDQALRGAVTLIEKNRPVVLIEIIKTDRDFVTTYFKDRHYRAYPLGENLLAVPVEFNLTLSNLEPVF